jgi:hypothetical protein
MAVAQNATFKAKAPLVALPIAVSDKIGNPVDDLSEGDFVLLDNGLPRTATWIRPVFSVRKSPWLS